MVDKPADLPSTVGDWQQTPAAVQALVLALWAEVQQLRAELSTLREQVGKNSRNSSRPSSSDPPSVAPRKKPPSGRSSGGQRGHEGHGRRLLPVAQVDQVVPLKPDTCGQCGAALTGDDPHPQRHQVSEIPPVNVEVTEYQRHTLRCAHCQGLTEAPWPAGVPRGAFGVRLQALVGLLAGAYRLSQRQLQALRADGFGVALSVGSVAQLEQATSQALAAPVEEAQA